jgi:DNA helicase-2/ATP-dependent DNA helicase PcrA
MIDIEKDLNESQRTVVTTTEGPVLVIAGAGSGKTRVIEYRVVHLVQKGVLPQSILLLTFTRKAAQQMLDRASGRDPRCMHVEGGTFHSFPTVAEKIFAFSRGSITFFYMDEMTAERHKHMYGKLGIRRIRKRSFPGKTRCARS